MHFSDNCIQTPGNFNLKLCRSRAKVIDLSNQQGHKYESELNQIIMLLFGGYKEITSCLLACLTL